MYYVYRKNGGEVFTASVNPMEGWEGDYFGVIESETNFELALGYWSDGVEIRLASQEEKDYWQEATISDDREMQKIIAKDVFEGAPNMSVAIRAFRALVVLFTTEINKLRVLHGLPEYTGAQVKQALWNAIDGSPE